MTRLTSRSPTFRADFLRLVQANMLRHADELADTTRLALYVRGEALADMIAEALADANKIRAEFADPVWHAVQLARWNLHAPICNEIPALALAA